jgi:hypothetical protein
MAELQLRAQAGLAATPDLSFLAACLARPVLEIENPQEFLGPLQIETLEMMNRINPNSLWQTTKP